MIRQPKAPEGAKTYNLRETARRAAIRSGLAPRSFWLLEAEGGGWFYQPKKPFVCTDPAEIAVWNEMLAIGYPEIVDGQIVNEPWKSNALRNR
jgi:hypothetical protein